MKTYKIVANGKSYTLSGITDNVKQEIEDAVQAREKMRNHRQLKKGLIPTEVFVVEQQSIQAIHFQTEPCLLYIATPDGHKHLWREILIAGGIPEPTDQDVSAVYLAQTVEGSEAWATAKQIWEDAYPKAPTVTEKTRAAPKSRKSTASETIGSAS